MTHATQCPKCGLRYDISQQNGCPNCLMGMGLEDWATADQRRSAGSSDRLFRPPSPSDLNDKIPNIEVLDLLGQGGMGAVYKARQIHLDRIVALKIIKPDVQEREDFADRFRREAKTMARLNHPHIVTVYEFGQFEGLFYLIMEYVEGVTLRHLIRTKELSPDEALAIVPELCDALQFAHDQGVVHRDIKPENILVDRQGHVRVTDFGLAKLLEANPADQHLTKTGQVMGTPNYMAPEQVEHPLKVDHRADIYSMGVVFYEMLTGELPMGRFQKPSQRVKLDVRLDEVVLRALEKQPEQRYQLASQIATDIKSLHGKDPLLAGYSEEEDEERKFWIDVILNAIVGLLLTVAIAIAIIYTRSGTPIYAFALSWWLLGTASEYFPKTRYEIWWIAGFVFVAHMAMIILAVVYTESTDAFWSLMAMFSAFGIGCYMGREDLKLRQVERADGG